MRLPRPRRCFGAALVLAAAGLAALAASAPARPATPWYQVEAVVFAREGESPRSRDGRRGEGPPPLAENTVELLPALGPAGGAAGSGRRHAFRSLPASQLDLAASAAGLNRAADYRVLLHVGWRQPGFRSADAPAVHLGTLRGGVSDGRFTAAPGEAVDGTIRLWRSRFLHVDVDLSFGDVEAWRRQEDAGITGAEPGDESRGRNPPEAGAAPSASTTQPAAPDPAAVQEGAGEASEPRPARPAGSGDRVSVTRLTRGLRLRAGRLHYLDHPLLGVLLTVKRLR